MTSPSSYKNLYKTLPTVVIKVGTSSLIRADKNCLNLTSLASIVETVRDLRSEGYNVVLVSSGAVGVGCQRLGLTTRPTELAKKQALAAVGQVHLMRYYDDLFSACGLTCSQVLLTLDNLANRGQYLNAANTFGELLNYGVVPVVNENDTVAVEQLRIGDNDTLSAQVATVVQAEWLFLLTDVDALYTSNPSIDPQAKPIHDVPDLWSLQVDTSTTGTQWGTGGMATKLTAARIATAGGCNMAICHFLEPRNILAILNGERVGTVFRAVEAPVRGRKRWVLSMPVKGEIWLDAGAVRAVRDRRCSLFSAGVIQVKGDFQAQDAIRICDEMGREFGRGLINYDRADADKLKGLKSREFLLALGPENSGQEEVIHRANLCLLGRGGGAVDGGEGDDDEEDGGEGSEIGHHLHDQEYDGMSPAGLSRSLTPAFGLSGSDLGGGGAGFSLGDGGNSGSREVMEEEVRARLAMLTSRAEAVEGQVGGSGGDDWRGEAVAVAALERAAEMAAMRGGVKVTSEEDVDEAGWLPRQYK